MSIENKRVYSYLWAKSGTFLSRFGDFSRTGKGGPPVRGRLLRLPWFDSTPEGVKYGVARGWVLAGKRRVLNGLRDI
jgi:hypothetical protein